MVDPGEEILKAPTNGVTNKEITDLTEDNLRFLVFNLKNEEGNAQKIANKQEVSEFITDRYKATLNLDNLVVENGTLKITGPLITTEDWNKVKANGDKTTAYRITVLVGEDKNKKAVKIAIYQDGKAVIEEI